jgi:hypothetical protein
MFSVPSSEYGTMTEREIIINFIVWLISLKEVTGHPLHITESILLLVTRKKHTVY